MSRRTKSFAPPSLLRARLQLEQLEDRNLLSVNVLENFESALLSNYRSLFHAVPAADVHPAAAHDGSPGLGLIKHDGYEWLARNDAVPPVARGQTVSVWAQFASAADGRLYFGFATVPQTSTQATSAFRALSLTLAANTNQMLLQRWTGNSNPTILGTTPFTYNPDQWYRLEVEWGATGSLEGRLYDSDGTTLLASVNGSDTTIASGRIGFRAFGSDKYFDTVVLDTDSTATVEERAFAGGFLTPDWTPGVPPPARQNLPADGTSPVPWQYRNAVGTGRDILLQSYNQLQQFARTIDPATGLDSVALAGANVSLNTGTVGVDWGPQFGGPATPLLAQYIYRQRPGEPPQLIGRPGDPKHFFAPSILNPGSTDPYGSSLNASQSLMTPGAEIDPMTGVLHRPTFQRTANVDGINSVTVPHTYAPLDLRLTVPIADLDPAQNPAGTRWYLMGNVFVEGDTNTANNSRWVRIQPTWNGTTFSFTYPEGSGGQLDFTTIPGLKSPAVTVRIIDNSDPFAFFVSGDNWASATGTGGFGDSLHTLDAGTTSDYAIWLFTGLAPGRYRISATYPAHAAHGVQNYTLYDGSDVRGTAVVNAGTAPLSLSADGALWTNLGNGLYDITRSDLYVILSGQGGGQVVADGIRIERIGVDPAAGIVDDGDAGFFATEGFFPFAGQGFQGDVAFAAAGDGSDFAGWLFTGLGPGVYEVSITWSADPNRATDAPFSVFDGLSYLGTTLVNQEEEPGDFAADDATWQSLGTFSITSGTLMVLLGNNADEYVIADAVRIVRVG